MASQHSLIHVFKENTLKPIAVVMLLITGKMCLNKEYRTSLLTQPWKLFQFTIRRNSKKIRGSNKKNNSSKSSLMLQTQRHFFMIKRKDIDY